ncbi:hypothetical protein MKZ38_001813 [Zalerion maritima]|uniref:Uncharacterized protein n=1 Tax=Zalerion maritima TaxID=339359 RepID=A0AAD5WSY1_9PEZI|nr:hypothetical protein MKZ38_001813 [Zalerion maritima]
MCTGSFFSDWRGCRSCLAQHGFLPGRGADRFLSALDLRSPPPCALDGAEPSAELSELFESAAAEQPAPTGGSAGTGHVRLDESTAASLYHTASSSSQGPGIDITWSAAAAGGDASETSATDSREDDSQSTKTRTTLSGTGSPTSTTDASEDEENAGPFLGVPVFACAFVALLGGV